MIGTKGMAVPDDPIQHAAQRSYPGQASWGGCGPIGTTCSQCTRWGGNRKKKPRPTEQAKCSKYREIMGPLKPWPTVPGDAPSCRHYDPVAKPWSGTAPAVGARDGEQTRLW